MIGYLLGKSLNLKKSWKSSRITWRVWRSPNKK